MDGIDSDRTRDGIYVLQTDFPKMIETFDEKDGLRAFALFNPSKKAVAVVVLDINNMEGYFSAFTNKVVNGKGICGEGLHPIMLSNR